MIKKSIFSLILILGLFISSSIFSKEVNVSAYNDKEIQVTVVPLQKISQIYQEIILKQDIPFIYPDGCHAKAQNIALKLEELGIISGKAFIEGYIYYNSRHWGEKFWLFHVASFVMVEEDGEIIPYVLDPLLFNHPVSHKVWRETVFKKKKSKSFKEYFTNRFVYDPPEKELDLFDYNPEFIEDMNEVFRQLNVRIEFLARHR